MNARGGWIDALTRFLLQPCASRTIADIMLKRTSLLYVWASALCVAAISIVSAANASVVEDAADRLQMRQRLPSAPEVVGSARNVLLLIVDDLRPELGAYGAGHMRTPAVDALAASTGSTLFTSAMTQQAICCPSRSSFLTGRRPETTMVWDLVQYWRTTPGGGNFTSLPEYFKQHGFETAGAGKVFHPAPGAHDDVPYSWTRPYFQPPASDDRLLGNFSHCWWAVPDSVPDSEFPDGAIAQATVANIKSLASSGKRFFVAAGEPPPPGWIGRRTLCSVLTHATRGVCAGLHRPHLPWVAPQRFFDMYPDGGQASFPEMPTDWGAAKQYAWDPQSGPRHMGDSTWRLVAEARRSF